MCFSNNTHEAEILALVCQCQARKALRALKGLVKLQALVRGYLVRKRAAATLHSMQALIRAQNAARSQRARRSFNKENRLFPEIHARKSIVRSIPHSLFSCLYTKDLILIMLS